MRRNVYIEFSGMTALYEVCLLNWWDTCEKVVELFVSSAFMVYHTIIKAMET
jgi:hypothetical protein